MVKALLYSVLFHLCLFLALRQTLQPSAEYPQIIAVLTGSGPVSLSHLPRLPPQKRDSTRPTLKSKTEANSKTRMNEKHVLHESKGEGDGKHQRVDSSSQLKAQGPDLGDLGDLGADFILQIRNKIQASLTYPVSLRRRRVEGSVQIQLNLNGQGQVESVKVIQSSGLQELDTLALEAVKAAAPFELPEHKPEMGRLKINLPIEFKLNHS